jgi:hypothetical protein
MAHLAVKLEVKTCHIVLDRLTFILGGRTHSLNEVLIQKYIRRKKYQKQI